MEQHRSKRKVMNVQISAGRRTFLTAGIGLAAASLLPVSTGAAQTMEPDVTSNDGSTATQPERTRMLGSLQVSAIGLGCLAMVGYYGGGVREKKASVNLIRAAVDQGVTFFDTAEVYGPHISEDYLGSGFITNR